MLVSGSILGQLELEPLFIGAQTKDEGLEKRKPMHMIFIGFVLGAGPIPKPSVLPLCQTNADSSDF